MTRIRLSLGLVLTGALLQLVGLAVDAWLHSQDPNLATTEGVLTLANPGHALFALGLVLVVIGACAGWTGMGARNGATGGRTGAAALFVPAVFLLLGGVTFAFAYSTGGLTGSHGADGHHAVAQVSAVSDHHHGESDAEVGGIEASRHTHDTEIAITDKELRSLVAELDVARGATERFKNIEVARRAGFVQVTQDLPGIAAHFINFRSAQGTTFDPATPQILLYTKQSGDWQLVGVSYTSDVLTSGADPGPPPQGFSGPLDGWHFHDNLCFIAGPRVFVADSAGCVAQNGIHVARTPWMLHVWLYGEAPGGIFAHADSTLFGTDN